MPVDLTDPEMRERAAREGAAVVVAAAQLGAAVLECGPVALRRTGVYRVLMRGGLGARAATTPQCRAAKVTSLRDSITNPEQVHRLVHDLHARGAPVPAPLHPDLLDVDGLKVAFWPWLAPAHVTARQWGALTAAFHRSGAPVVTGPHDARPGPYRPDTVLHARLEVARALAETPGHPLHQAQDLLDALARALDAAVQEALTAEDTAPTVIALGDNQPGNIMRAPSHDSRPERLVLNDFERLVTGPPGLDLAAVLMGIWHYRFPPESFEQFRRGYGPDAPTRDQALPFARLRELSGLLVAMLQAETDPAMAQQIRVRAGCLSGPGAGAAWTFVGDHAAMRLLPAETQPDHAPDAGPE